MKVQVENGAIVIFQNVRRVPKDLPHSNRVFQGAFTFVSRAVGAWYSADVIYNVGGRGFKYYSYYKQPYTVFGSNECQRFLDAVNGVTPWRDNGLTGAEFINYTGNRLCWAWWG
jgi:hypothetical protein